VEHPVLTRIRRDCFTPLGWFEPSAEDQVPHSAKFVILIGNAGPDMFARFSRERDEATSSLDHWTREVVAGLASDLDARTVFPFDKPALPFLSWARRAGAGNVSPLGLNIHETYGLWHAYRAALLFPVVFDMPLHRAGGHPCESCAARPCLDACPVSAFDGASYDVRRCGQHLLTEAGTDCMQTGCKARRACPVGKGFAYEARQMQFHMTAFKQARREEVSPASDKPYD
jgi:hypothetical protein